MANSYKVSDKLFIDTETGEQTHIMIEALNNDQTEKRHKMVVLKRSAMSNEFKHFRTYTEQALSDCVALTEQIIPARDTITRIDLLEPQETDQFSENSQMDENGAIFATLVQSVKSDDLKLDRIIQERKAK